MVNKITLKWYRESEKEHLQDVSYKQKTDVGHSISRVAASKIYFKFYYIFYLVTFLVQSK